MTLTDTQKSVANKLIDDLAMVRNYLSPYQKTNPGKEIIIVIDAYFQSLIPEFRLDEDDVIAGVEKKGWLTRLKDRVYRRGKDALNDGLKVAGWVRGKLIIAYNKTKNWAKENPTKAVVIAYFGIPVVINQAVKYHLVVGQLASAYTIYKTFEVAAKVTEDTIREEVVSPITTLLWIAGAVGVVWLFREELFGG